MITFSKVTFNQKFLEASGNRRVTKKRSGSIQNSAPHGGYKWFIMHEKCGRPDSNGFQLKWRFGTHGHRKNQNPGGRFGATS